jgi:hypothetical protein
VKFLLSRAFFSKKSVLSEESMNFLGNFLLEIIVSGNCLFYREMVLFIEKPLCVKKQIF